MTGTIWLDFTLRDTYPEIIPVKLLQTWFFFYFFIDRKSVIERHWFMSLLSVQQSLVAKCRQVLKRFETVMM